MMMCFYALTVHKPAHGHGHCHGRKAGKWILARTKAQERLLLFWMGCVCVCLMVMGVLYSYEPTRALYVPELAKYPLISYLHG
jgi:hypothetical protein